MLTATAAFADFRGNLEITGLQDSLVAARQVKVRAAAARGLTVLDSFLTGSYRRYTLIGPMRDADVDIVTVLDRGYRRCGPRAVLDLVKDTLRETYPSSKISRNGQAVTITFSDFTVDVVPAFTPWWDSDSLDICNSGDNTWIRTSPRKHIGISSKINQRTGGLLVPSVKMLKAWKPGRRPPAAQFPPGDTGLEDLRSRLVFGSVVGTRGRHGLGPGKHQRLLRRGTRSPAAQAARPSP